MTVLLEPLETVGPEPAYLRSGSVESPNPNYGSLAIIAEIGASGLRVDPSASKINQEDPHACRIIPGTRTVEAGEIAAQVLIDSGLFAIRTAMNPYAPTSIFTRDITHAPLAEDQTYAKRLGNQSGYCKIGEVGTYSYDGKPAPSFFNYAGTGFGSTNKNFQRVLNCNSGTPSIFVVPASQPTQKVTLRVSEGGAERAPGSNSNLQKYFENVPLPKLTELPSKNLIPGGVDKHVIIWQPSTDKMWEMYQFYGTEGSYNFVYGGYAGPDSPGSGFQGVSEWNGVWLNLSGGKSSWGARGCNLSMLGGMFTMQDAVEALRGKPIKHALAVSACVVKNLSCAPATRNDSQSNTNGTAETNPAFGTVDEVPEGSKYRLPKILVPGEFGITQEAEPLQYATFIMLQKYGLMVVDRSGAFSFQLESPLAMGSSFAYCKTNPFIGADTVSAEYKTINTIAPGWGYDPTLPVVKEAPGGSKSMFLKLPLHLLEQIEPFAS